MGEYQKFCAIGVFSGPANRLWTGSIHTNKEDEQEVADIFPATFGLYPDRILIVVAELHGPMVIREWVNGEDYCRGWR